MRDTAILTTIGVLTAWMLLVNKSTRSSEIGKTDTDRISDTVHSTRVQKDVVAMLTNHAGVVLERVKLLRAYVRAK